MTQNLKQQRAPGTPFKPYLKSTPDIECDELTDTLCEFFLCILQLFWALANETPSPPLPMFLHSFAVVIVASDGLWDMMNEDLAVQFVWDYMKSTFEFFFSDRAHLTLYGVRTRLIRLGLVLSDSY